MRPSTAFFLTTTSVRWMRRLWSLGMAYFGVNQPQFIHGVSLGLARSHHFLRGTLLERKKGLGLINMGSTLSGRVHGWPSFARPQTVMMSHARLSVHDD